MLFLYIILTTFALFSFLLITLFLIDSLNENVPKIKEIINIVYRIWGIIAVATLTLVIIILIVALFSFA